MFKLPIASLVEFGNKKMNDPSLSDDEKKEIRTKVAKYDKLENGHL